MHNGRTIVLLNFWRRFGKRGSSHGHGISEDKVLI